MRKCLSLEEKCKPNHYVFAVSPSILVTNLAGNAPLLSLAGIVSRWQIQTLAKMTEKPASQQLMTRSSTRNT
jgi:hypothetical protein